MGIVAAVVGVVAIVGGIKLFGGSPADDEMARPQKLAQRDAKTEHGGWSVRSNSQDPLDADAGDIKVPRQAAANPGGIAPPRRGEPSAPQGGQHAASGQGENAAQPDSGSAAGVAPANPSGVDGTNRSAPSIRIARANQGIAPGSQPVAQGEGGIEGGGVAAVNAPGAAADAPAGNEPKPAQDQQAQQPTPPAPAATPGDVAAGSIYDSKDTTFSMDTPTEVKDIPPISGHGVTMMMNLDPQWADGTANQDDVALLKLGDNLELSKNVHFLRLQYTDANGSEHSIGSDMTTWQDIQPPYSIAATVNENQLALIVNGKLVAHDTTEGLPYEPTADPTLQIGCFDYPASRPCAPGDASGVVVVPPVSNAELITKTTPANAKH